MKIRKKPGGLQKPPSIHNAGAKHHAGINGNSNIGRESKIIRGIINSVSKNGYTYLIDQGTLSISGLSLKKLKNIAARLPSPRGKEIEIVIVLKENIINPRLRETDDASIFIMHLPWHVRIDDAIIFHESYHAYLICSDPKTFEELKTANKFVIDMISRGFEKESARCLSEAQKASVESGVTYFSAVINDIWLLRNMLEKGCAETEIKNVIKMTNKVKASWPGLSPDEVKSLGDESLLFLLPLCQIEIPFLLQNKPLPAELAKLFRELKDFGNKVFPGLFSRYAQLRDYLLSCLQDKNYLDAYELFSFFLAAHNISNNN